MSSAVFPEPFFQPGGHPLDESPKCTAFSSNHGRTPSEIFHLFGAELQMPEGFHREDPAAKACPEELSVPHHV